MKHIKKSIIWILVILIILLLFNYIVVNDAKHLREISSQPDDYLNNEDFNKNNDINTNESYNMQEDGHINADSNISNQIVVLETNKGNITLELNKEKAPITVTNFLDYVNSGFYEGTIFHRVIKNFMIQGGGFLPDGTKKETKEPIVLESDNGLKNLEGTIAMARTNEPNSATSQFFINTVDNDLLNYSEQNPGYAVFGKVIDGMDVVKSIEDINTTSKGAHQNWPVEDIIIKKVYLK